MRAVRFGPVLALAAAAALGGCTAHPREIGLASAGVPPGELDRQLDHALAAMIASAEIGPHGEVFYSRALGDQRFLEPNSGRYWQVSGAGQEVFRSRSLWDRTLHLSGSNAGTGPLHYDSGQFPDEPLRIVARTVRLPGSDVEWLFVVAGARSGEPGRQT